MELDRRCHRSRTLFVTEKSMNNDSFQESQMKAAIAPESASLSVPNHCC